MDEAEDEDPEAEAEWDERGKSNMFQNVFAAGSDLSVRDLLALLFCV